MTQPAFSVVIPAYQQAEFIAETIQSVLRQTCSDFEVIVVDDASTDRTPDVVALFDDPRIKYFRHGRNLGLPAARNTGIRIANGDLIALLDADDLFHPEKLECHRRFLQANPAVGVSYNARYDLHHGAGTIRELWRPPLTVDLADLVMGFPFAPSDMVIRREWVFRVGLFDESYVDFSEDLDINCRLALAGCAFAGLDRSLNYRRYHAGRIIRNLRARADAALRAIDSVFADQRCPEAVRSLGRRARKEHLLVWGSVALAQGDVGIGLDLLHSAVKLDPDLIHGVPADLVRFLTVNALADESVTPELMLWRVLTPIADDLPQLREQYDWAVARAYLLKAVRAMLWGRSLDSEKWFVQAVALGAELDEAFLGYLAHTLDGFEAEVGVAPTRKVIGALVPFVERLGGRRSARWLIGCHAMSRAHEYYRNGYFTRVPASVAQAIASNPAYLVNRGIWSIFVRSILGGMRPRTA